jgi:hypothetical protein
MGDNIKNRLKAIRVEILDKVIRRLFENYIPRSYGLRLPVWSEIEQYLSEVETLYPVEKKVYTVPENERIDFTEILNKLSDSKAKEIEDDTI